jgi:hypothetical protein
LEHAPGRWFVDHRVRRRCTRSTEDAIVLIAIPEVFSHLLDADFEVISLKEFTECGIFG